MFFFLLLAGSTKRAGKGGEISPPYVSVCFFCLTRFGFSLPSFQIKVFFFLFLYIYIYIYFFFFAGMYIYIFPPCVGGIMLSETSPPPIWIILVRVPT